MKRMIFFGGLALASVTLAAAADAEYFARSGSARATFSGGISAIGETIGNSAKALIGGQPTAHKATMTPHKQAVVAARTEPATVAFEAHDMPARQALVSRDDSSDPLAGTGFTKTPDIEEANVVSPATTHHGAKTSGHRIDAADGEPTDIPGPAITLLFALATIAVMRRFA